MQQSGTRRSLGDVAAPTVIQPDLGVTRGCGVHPGRFVGFLNLHLPNKWRPEKEAPDSDCDCTSHVLETELNASSTNAVTWFCSTSRFPEKEPRPPVPVLSAAFARLTRRIRSATLFN